MQASQTVFHTAVRTPRNVKDVYVCSSVAEQGALTSRVTGSNPVTRIIHKGDKNEKYIDNNNHRINSWN